MKRFPKEIKKYIDDMNEGIKNHSLTFSGWLIGVKKLSDKQISDLFDNHKEHLKLEKEYEKWLRLL